MLVSTSRANGRRGILFLLGLGVWLVNSPAVAQSYVRNQWSVEDGLPVNTVNDLLQTRDGYLWLATFDGLVRFDGTRFTVFNTSDADGLPSNRIVHLQEDAAGNLWLTTEENHLVRFRNGVFTHFDESRGLPGNFTGTLYEDKAGTLWVGTNRGVARYQDDQILPYRPDALDAYVIALLQDTAGNLWVGTAGQGLWRVRPDGTVQRFTTTNGLTADVVTHMYEDRGGIIWASTTRGTSYFVESRFAPLTENNIPWEKSILKMHQDTNGAYWIATGTGWFIYRDERLAPFMGADQDPIEPDLRVLRDPSDHLWVNTRRILYRDGEPVFEAEDAITTTFLDREGNLWVATSTEGVFRLRPTIFTVYGIPEGLPGNNVYPILQDQSGAVWLGTLNHGLARLDGETVTSFNTENGRLASKLVASLYEDRAGTLWVGGTGLYRREGARFVQSTFVPDEADVRALYESPDGDFWVSTENGLLRYHRETNTAAWTRTTADTDLTQHWIRLFYETRDGVLWLGTNGGGLLRYRDGRFTSFTTADGLCSNVVSALYEDTNGILWMGSEDQGLCRIFRDDTNTETLPWATPIRMRDGLYDNSIRQILEDDQGRLWMSSSRGIFWIERARLDAFAQGFETVVNPVVYTERDGMRSREVTGGGQPAGMKARDGRLWFPTRHGAVVVDPATMHAPEAPPVVIEDVRFDGVLQPHGTPLTATAAQNDVEISYSALTLTAPELVRYRYQLEGYENDWHEAGANQVARYTNLPPGTYTFRVIAANNGVWNEEGASLTLTRSPLFYETQGFFVLGLILLLLGSLALYRYRMRLVDARTRALEENVAARTAEVIGQKNQLEERNLQLRETEAQLKQQTARLMALDAAKSRFFTNVSHEFRTPLTLVLGLLDELQHKGPDAALHDEETGELITLAHQNGQRLLRLINQLLDLSKLEAGGLTLHRGRHDLVGFLRNMTASFESMARARGLTLSFHAAAETLPHAFDADKLEEVILNLLSNALKFTPDGGAVTVRLRRQTEGAAVIEVSDTGAGIAPDHLPHLFDRFYQADDSATRAQEGAGIGLALVKEFVELHGGTILVDSALGAGTTFTIVLPDAEDADAATPSEAVSAALSHKHLSGDGSSDGQRIPENLIVVTPAERPAANGSADTNGRQASPSSDGITHPAHKQAGLLRSTEKASLRSGVTHPAPEPAPDSDPGGHPSQEGNFREETIHGEPPHEETLHEETLHRETPHEETLHEGTPYEGALHEETLHTPNQETPLLRGVPSAARRGVSTVEADQHDEASTARLPASDQEDADEDATIVLVVEDNADMRAYIRVLLAGNYHVVEANNGRDGLDRALELVPDLILSDVMMPVMDGYALCEALKADDRTSHVPVVLLTAKADQDSRLEGLTTGADDYLAKPFDAQELRVRVRNLIEQRQALRERFSQEVVRLGVEDVDLPSRDVAFLENVQAVVEARLGDSGFGVDALADEVAMSRRQLLRKLRALTDETPNQMIRRLRLERAAQLLRQDTGSVKEVAYETGFSSLSHFRRAFRETYDVSPSDYADAASAPAAPTSRAFLTKKA